MLPLIQLTPSGIVKMLRAVMLGGWGVNRGPGRK